MTLNPEMPVFHRSGVRIGELTKWSVTTARSHRLNDVEDFAFHIPRYDENNAAVLTAGVVALLARDNIIYIENEVEGLPGWGGAISDVNYRDDAAHVKVLGGLSLLDAMDSGYIDQSGGTAASIAQRLVGAANAKKGAHGDLIMGFVVDATRPNYGRYEFEGNVLSGLTQLADATMSEFYVESILAPDGQSIAFTLHWGDRFVTLTGITLTDGPDGHIASSPDLLFSAIEMVNSVHLRGASTSLGDFVDYSSVRNIIQDITPEISVTVDTPDNIRRREDLQLSVSFGYSDDVQRGLAAEVQQRYVDLYKTFLYAWHDRRGMPFLPGYDWEGPSKRFPERKLTETRFRTIRQLGTLTKGTVLTNDSPNIDDALATEDADIENWQHNRDIFISNAVGVAQSFVDPDRRIVAAGDGLLYEMDETDDTLEALFSVQQGGESLVGVATDPANSEYVWVLLDTGSGSRVRWYDIDDGTALGSWDIGTANPNDLYVDVSTARAFIVADGQSNVIVRDLNSGITLSPDESFASGFSSPRGISGSGGAVYVINGPGQVRILNQSDGTLMGEFNADQTSRGLFVDADDSLVFLVDENGDLRVYDANVVTGIVDDDDDVVGAPGFAEIHRARYVHVALTSEVRWKPWARPDTEVDYTVVDGDTLSSVARTSTGHRTNWRDIYWVNRDVIREAALANGLPPDSHRLFAGTVLTVPGNLAKTVKDQPANNKVRFLMTYTKGWWETNTIPGPIGQPDYLEREWAMARKQTIGFAKAKRLRFRQPVVVIYGEEGRVDDWDPQELGYGVYKRGQVYRTKSGYQRNTGAGWYPRDWDIPDSEWIVEPPAWPEGEEYLNAYLAKVNQEATAQSLTVVNRAGLWGTLSLGAVYTLTLAHQGPTTGISLSIRVLGFAPSEFTGTCELTAEVYVA